MPAKRRLPRPLRWLLLGAAYLLLGIIALVALALVAINIPLVNGRVAREVTNALEPNFKGRIVLHRLGYVDFGGVLGAEAEVLDTAGNSVIAARDVDVRVFWPGLVWRILTSDSPTTVIDIDRIAVEHVRIGLFDDGTGTPTLASAFEPRQTEPEATEPGGTVVTLEEISVREAEVRGSLASPGPIDADLANLQASLESSPDRLHLVLKQLDLSARQLPVIDTLSGNLTADVMLPSEPEGPTAGQQAPAPSASGEQPTTTTFALRPAPPPRRITAAFAGELAGSGASAQVRMLGEEILAELEAPALEPKTLARLAPGLAPRAPASLVAKVEGALSDFGFDARVEQGGASVAARGRVRQADETSTVRARVDVARLNLANLLEDGADTELTLGADARLSFDAKGGKGDYTVASKSSRFGAEPLPELRLHGDVALPSERPVTTTGTLSIDEPGAPTEVTYLIEAAESGTRTKVSSLTKLSSPERLAALTGGLAADGVLTTRAELDAATERIDASFDLDLGRLQHPQARARRVRVQGRADGDMALPRLDVTAQLRGVNAGGRKFSTLRAAARGTPSRLMLSARADGSRQDHIVLTTALTNAGVLALEKPQVTVVAERGTLLARAERVAFPEGKVEVDRLTLDGPGRAELSLRYGPGLERLTLHTERLEPACVLDIIGVESPLSSGALDAHAEIKAGRAAPSGRLELSLTNLGLGKLRGARAEADLVLQSGKLSGTAEVELARGAKTALAVRNLKVPLNGTSAELRGATGDVALDGQVDLKQLQVLLPLLGLERAEGKVRFDITLERPPGESSPRLRAHVETKSLVIVQERPDAGQTQSAEAAQSTSPLWVRGIDLELDASLDQQHASFDGKLFDRQGDIVRVSADWRELGGLGNLARLRERFEQAPFKARVDVPPRAFDKFPATIRPSEVAGIFSMGVEAEGSLREPRVRARGRVERFGAAVERRGAPRLDLELAADYAQEGGGVRLRAHDRSSPRLDLDARWRGDAALLASRTDGKSPITGDVRLSLDAFPIAIVPALENRQISGKLSGAIELEQLGKDARLNLDVTSQELRIDRLRVGEVKSSVQAQGGQVVMQASIDGQAGKMNAKLETGFIWRDRLLPVLDERLTGSLRAADFRLAALQPLVEGSVSELDGKLDADLRAVVEDGAPRLSGRVQLAEGSLHLPSIGQQFRSMSALVKVSPETITLEKLTARGVSGGFEADASAKLEGLTPVAASANVRISEKNKLPLTVEGEAVGDGWGTITAEYEHDEANKRNILRVDLQKFSVELPQTPPKGIQDLSQPEHVRVGFHRRDGDFVVIPLQPMEEPGAPSEYETIVIVELGSVRIEKGQQVEVALGGEVRATLGEELDVQGKIESRRGQLDISGKQFDIERATVTFTGGKPDDPTINAIARYDSPSDFTVYAEYTGTVSQGSLRLSSEPPLSQDEILTLLLFGTPDGSVGAGSGTNSLATAVSVAGGTAAQGLNRALSDVTDLDVSARIDTSTGAPRPELVLQVSSRVAARVTQALGEPTPGQSPDRTFLTVELRLASSWSLSTMIGDKGASAVDLIWRRRY